MLKRIMLYLMMFVTATKLIGLAVLLSTDPSHLPYAVTVSAGFLAVWGLFLICKNIVKPIMKKELISFYWFLVVSVLFNIFFMKISSRMELTMLDFLVIGTFMDVLFGAVLVILSARENRYIRIRVHSGRA